MRAIINDRLYNTETAEKICSFRRKVKEYDLLWMPGYCYAPYHSFDVYLTPKGSYFKHDTEANTISVMSEDKVKASMRDLYPDEYMKRFGEVEEA